MKEIAHRIHEYLSGALPPERLFDFLWNQTNIKALFKWMSRYAAKALGKAFGVTMFTAGADF
jgi:hypothetical protein